ncbi:hypothetical protein JM946_12845 [Steroidobacter sp. S1-65]|uniref:EfeO-type cupredoxin-like domain-containing protein n=1 Tax=Steroidobacter gossypii TaxID=2805490 RepID=A0ABS1WXI2_9GAMM|nr:hypothetical protein [Steroidobacter gossypii]MBM0105647.1 hypothetical protein [Steroidobacter gossypii]
MSRRKWPLIPAIALGVAIAWAALAPMPESPRREQPFVIPEGTWARRMSGDQVDILPQQIRLTLGVNDVLFLKNLDTVPQTFGPALLMPGQSFRLPFELASEYQFACSAHSSGQMTVIVDPYPASPWGRLRWRTLNLVEAFGNKTHEPKS